MQAIVKTMDFAQRQAAAFTLVTRQHHAPTGCAEIDGDKIIAFDSHIDTVGVQPGQLDCDPYEGYEDDEVIYGRGGSDQEGGMAAATYGAKIMKELG